MARYIDADEALRMMRNSKEDKPSRGDWDIAHDCCIDCVNGALTADVVEVEKVAKILTDVTEKAPCEIVGANEWDYDYCNCAELCSQSNYEQCWVRYFKHCKERSEGDG